jgi:hypothetical protein
MWRAEWGAADRVNDPVEGKIEHVRLMKRHLHDAGHHLHGTGDAPRRSE